MSESEIAIRCKNVGKRFCRDLKTSLWYGVKDSVADLLGHRGDLPAPELRSGEFWANKDISFELRRGEALSLIGRNGAGKTTLLKMLNGLIKPDTGLIEIHGRVGALIALGAGFNPVLTGRENIFVNASILGMTRRQTADLLDEILDFAEISDAIDSPVRTYSSGMNVRLGFAIATCLRPDVLIVDEVLAVGDAGFRLKCLQRMRNVLNTGCAVLLVSHSMTDVRNLSDSVLWLKDGHIQAFGEPYKVVTQYLGTSHSETAEINWPDDTTAPGGKAVKLRKLSVLPPKGEIAISISTGAILCLKFDCRELGLRLGFTVEVCTEEQIVVFHTGGRLTPEGDSKVGMYEVDITLPANFLNSGKYQLSVIVGESQSIVLAEAKQCLTFRVLNEAIGMNHTQRPGVVAPQLPWAFSVLSG